MMDALGWLEAGHGPGNNVVELDLLVGGWGGVGISSGC